MNSLNDLEERLRDLSHSTDALQIIQEFTATLGKTKNHQSVFNASGALIQPPIFYETALGRGLVSTGEDEFLLLQGDIVATDAAYFMGERLINRRFLVANSTCDLVPERREFVALLPLQRIKPGETSNEQEQTKRLISELLTFRSTRRMYLPPMPHDFSDVLANAVEFDGFAHARLADILLSERIASLSLVGWRIFAAHVRSILTRTAESEVYLRTHWG